MTADHNHLNRRLRALYKVLTAAGRAPAGGYVPLSNLEYKTPALDEMAGSSDWRFKNMADAIDRDARGIFDKRPAHRSTLLAQTQDGVRTGTPVTSLEHWLGDPSRAM